MKNHGNPEIPNCEKQLFGNIYQRFQFLDDVPDSYICLLCKQVVNNPIQTPCGCRYCQDCITNPKVRYCCGDSEDCKQTLLDSKTKHPKDIAAIRYINTLKVQCIIKECKTIIYYKDIQDHVTNCEFGFMECDQCKLEIKRKDLLKHQKQFCNERKEKCFHCNENFQHKELKEIHNNIHHKDLCNKLTEKCPYNCEIIDKVLIVEHRLICSSKPTFCPFNRLGCDYLLYSCNLSKHFSDNNYQHSLLINETVNNIYSKAESLSKQIPIETGRLKNLRNCFDYTYFTKCLSELSNIGQNRNIPGNKSGNIIYKNGNFIWHIKSFSSWKSEAENGITVSRLSDPFFSSEFGYKLCMKIYPFGDGMGKGTHLSVFFTIMKGDYDDILSWPFKLKIVLSILDQTSRNKNFSETFIPDAKSVCFQKPNAEFNIATGSPKFMAFNQLESYIVNDSFFLKLSLCV